MNEIARDGLARMIDLVMALPDQLAASGDLDGLADLGPLGTRPREILLCGMGGSAIAGDLLQPVLCEAGLHLVVHRDYGLPRWVGDDTLVIASSYSGNTEETLSAVQAAQERGCVVVGISSGGELLQRSRGEGSHNRFPCVQLPGGLPPRASLGFGLGAVYWTLHHLGLTSSPGEEIATAVAVLRDGNALHGRDPSGEDNPSASLARLAAGRFLVLYSTCSEAHGAAFRWKAQLNENGKCPAYCVPFPELNHNDIVGWQLTPEMRQRFVLVVLRGGDEHERTARRVGITGDLINGEFQAVHRVTATGDRPLARILSLVQYGDFLSCHLAAMTGVDPMPVVRIESLKQRLRKGNGA